MTKKQKKTLLRIILSSVIAVALWGLCEIIKINNIVEFLLFLIPYFIIGYDILKKAIKGILNRQVFDENFLMAVATVGAIALGDYKEAVAVMLFYQIGELFQSFAVGKSRKNIAALMDIRPDYANIVMDGKICKVDPKQVPVGTEIIVNPGEKVPVDGIIVEGNTMFNTSALTGESMPRNAHKDDMAISGFINMTGTVKIKTTKNFDESTVSKILDLVENSSMKKSRSENFITKFARIYTPAVCCSALFIAIVPPAIYSFFGDMSKWGDWVIRALTFLVISCPCALVISIPLSFFGGIGCASKNGILVKGSNYLEALSDTGYMVFDKTGTLTKGFFEVQEIYTKDISRDELLYLAAHAESGSSHPISVSIKKAFGGEIDFKKVKNIEEIAGFGVKAVVEDKVVLAGNLKLMKKFNIETEPVKEGQTVVYVAVDEKYAGTIYISDTIKENAEKAVSDLKKCGIKKTVMLTGDNEKTAMDVAEKIGIDTVKYELLPGDKVSEIEKLLKEKPEKDKLAFVGDGINDAPVLTRADIGIAMGALGSDAAIEAADIVLMDDDPGKIPLAMKISKKTLKIVRENIVFALGIKAVCLILGALGLAGMWLAIFADVGVMLIAVINATRTLKIKTGKN